MSPKIKERLITMTFNAIVTFIVLLVMFWITGTFENNKKEKEELNSKASIEQVMEWDGEIYKYVDTHDDEIEAKIETMDGNLCEKIDGVEKLLQTQIEMLNEQNKVEREYRKEIRDYMQNNK